jgi:separase
MEQMISDPVFSVMQDSTISFPSIASSAARASMDKNSLVTSPPRRGRASAGDKRSAKDKSGPAFADALKQAQDILIEAHKSSLSTSDSGTVHRLSTLLQNTIILLSATSAFKAKPMLSSAQATVAVDLGRNITWTREQNIRTASSGLSTNGVSMSEDLPSSRKQPVTEAAQDMVMFQKNYVDLLPDNWSVISLSLSDGCHDLSITKLQAGHSPFILRLPLERANSRDADAEVFNFAHGREELLDIIKLANETSHSARDFSAKGERSAWWAQREALDTRLKDLLLTIETTWLGGFKGIFSQHQKRLDLLARFQKSFQQILDGSLPSRNRIRGKKASKTPSINLDPRILDLFIGLGDPTDPDCDYDEALNDLLYFVVDILQFHGERNAYDEIDFDAMVVETYDALRGYYSALTSLTSGSGREDGSHTILVLDKALHAFPWESLPCMEGLAVSRVPSLACLRQLITESNISRASPALPDGHYVSSTAGTYILNPSSDLKNTQAFFQPTFDTLKSWNSIVNKVPEESEFEDALSKSEILLYFGHGSGAQYIRGKTIRRLEKCRPATFLMGCSSAALTEAGEFECYGPVWNYLMAGCPAVVGTLWDVTDRDIDRFAGRAFEEWGLFAKGTFREDNKKNCKSRKGSAIDADGVEVDKSWEESSHAASPGSSLAEAVAKARDACKFKYLNAAAVVVYGIPVYIGREG